MSENSDESRLPPPAFPPGTRRRSYASSSGESDASGEPDPGAYISPDDPIPGRTATMSGAFISPDEPIPDRPIEPMEEFQAVTDGIEPDEEGEVVGMDLAARIEPNEVIAGGDPHVIELTGAISTLNDALHRKGEGGLRSDSEMSCFEATLRSYCVGYLAGRRAEEALPPVLKEPLPTDG